MRRCRFELPTDRIRKGTALTAASGDIRLNSDSSLLLANNLSERIPDQSVEPVRAWRYVLHLGVREDDRGLAGCCRGKARNGVYVRRSRLRDAGRLIVLRGRPRTSAYRRRRSQA
jgi:hypothetical protein